MAAAVAALLVVGVVAFALTRGGDGKPTPGATSTGGATNAGKARVAAFDTSTRKQTVRVPLSKGTGTLAVGFGSVWVANQGEDSVSRVDAKAGKVVATVHVGHRPSGIAASEDDPNVWVITADGVWGIDPLTNGVIATIKLAGLPLSVAVANGSVWVTYKISDAFPEGLFRIDPKTGTVVERIPVAESTFSPSPVGVAVGRDAVWVVTPGLRAGASGGFLNRWDLAAKRRTQYGIDVPVAVGPDAAWVLQANGIVLRMDFDTSKIVARVGTASGAAAIAVGEGAVWVVNRLKGTLTRIDQSTNEADAPLDVHGKPASVAVGDGLVWVRLDGS